MARQNIVREIVSPEKARFHEAIERTRARDRELLQQEIQRSESLLKSDGGIDVTNTEAQKGRILQRSVFVSRLKKLIPSIWYEQSLRYPDQGGLYVDDPRSPYGKRMVASMPHDYVFEFSVVVPKPSVIPDPTIALHWQKIQDVDSKRPGWRVVLLKLLMEGLVTATQIENEFQITRGRSSQKWQQATT